MVTTHANVPKAIGIEESTPQDVRQMTENDLISTGTNHERLLPRRQSDALPR